MQTRDFTLLRTCRVLHDINALAPHAAVSATPDRPYLLLGPYIVGRANYGRRIPKGGLKSVNPELANVMLAQLRNASRNLQKYAETSARVFTLYIKSAHNMSIVQEAGMDCQAWPTLVHEAREL